ncbi:MAG: hypothetical protein JOY79_10760 [Acidobacteriaceae bacterium]|nr:hypothetical protein [Acidobacteriaceae bacterium]
MKKLSVFLLAFVFATAIVASAQQSDEKPAANPLVRLLQSKGIISEQEAATVNQAGTMAEQQQRLSQLLLTKGIISQNEYEQTVAKNAAPKTDSAALVPAVAHMAEPSASAADPAPAPPDQKAPPVIPAVAPIRVLQLEPSKVGGLIPDVKLGSGAKIKFYGFFKMSSVYDTSSQQGNDFPLPGFLGDTGPEGSPEFHIKARASRFGVNFEWPDISEKNALTGRVEFDWEGNFSRANNRNISSIRSNALSLRLAWMRLDHRFNDASSWFAVFGQDWTPFGSSLLPNTLETTGVGIGFGSLYERAPQVRTGFFHSFGGSRKFGIGPEVAAVLPAFGNLPPFIGIQQVAIPATLPATSTATNIPSLQGNLGDQLGFGERQGVDAARPDIQGRLVLQFQLDKAKGVAPAQIIFSAVNARRRVNVLAGTGTTATGAGIPLCSNTTSLTACPLGAETFRRAFPKGAEWESSRNAAQAGIQLPTRFATFVASYYRGSDLRFYFAGQILQEFNATSAFIDSGGLRTATNITGALPGCVAGWNCAPSIDGSSVLLFGVSPSNGPYCAPIPGSSSFACPVPQLPVRTQGGFAELNFPLSRIFNAEPTGRNAGWTMTLHYGTDQPLYNDIHRFAGTTRARSEWYFGNVQYKMNQYVTIGLEESYYWTHALNAGVFEGGLHRTVHDFRSEFATIFTF